MQSELLTTDETTCPCGATMTQTEAKEFGECTTCWQNNNCVFCDCGVILTDADLDEYGEECGKCHAKSHFTCADCGETLDNDERSTKCKHRCVTCQETKEEVEMEEQKDTLKEEARDLLETLCSDGGLSDLKKAVAALKRLQVS